ncbi:MAG: metalloregulator ArsR/SmtB family transcription factor [Candidatus Krumholzibacteria bacterium]|jgi:ArsR family transcriptional regulator|nr:metalloregulator ArsR/SmtB family transcription factor [Candidatus Krumholzibacteria bacterium]
MLAALKALADRNRLRIVAALDGADELCACQITGLLAVTGATVSRHLAVLERAGLINKRRAGRWIWYCLAAAPRCEDLLIWLRRATAGDRRLAADRKTLAKILAVDPADYCRLQRGNVDTACTRTEKNR